MDVIDTKGEITWENIGSSGAGRAADAIYRFSIYIYNGGWQYEVYCNGVGIHSAFESTESRAKVAAMLVASLDLKQQSER